MKLLKLVIAISVLFLGSQAANATRLQVWLDMATDGGASTGPLPTEPGVEGWGLVTVDDDLTSAIDCSVASDPMACQAQKDTLAARNLVFLFAQVCGNGTNGPTCNGIPTNADVGNQFIEEFGFNSDQSLEDSMVILPDLSGLTIDGLPGPNYDASYGVGNPFSVTMDGWGKFDGSVKEKGDLGLQSVLVAIETAGDDAYTYVSERTDPQGKLFSIKISSGSGEQGGGGTFLAGGTVVPVPAAAWLFGSGLIGLAGVARRRNSAKG